MNKSKIGWTLTIFFNLTSKLCKCAAEEAVLAEMIKKNLFIFRTKPLKVGQANHRSVIKIHLLLFYS